jgi:hypothetical protein
MNDVSVFEDNDDGGNGGGLVDASRTTKPALESNQISIQRRLRIMAKEEEGVSRYVNEIGEPSKHTPFEVCTCPAPPEYGWPQYSDEKYHCAYTENLEHPDYGKSFLDE